MSLEMNSWLEKDNFIPKFALRYKLIEDPIHNILGWDDVHHGSYCIIELLD
jgi:hypothetical protein